MAAFTLKEVEDYLTERISGITIIDISVEFPAETAVFHIEGELEYYLFAHPDGTYALTDGQKQVKKSSQEDPENILSEEQFLNEVVKIIVEEE